MCNIYRVLASQYDPLRVILPYTTRAKVCSSFGSITETGMIPGELWQEWMKWEEELKYLPQVAQARCYYPYYMDHSYVWWEIHIFSDASEKAYGAVAYLLTEDHQRDLHLAFLLARSRVAPLKQQSILRVELFAALIGAQLANLLVNELTLKLNKIIYWTDSTTVPHWLSSESCRYKVFVGRRWRFRDLLTVQNGDMSIQKKTLSMIWLEASTCKILLGPTDGIRVQSSWSSCPLSPTHIFWMLWMKLNLREQYSAE